MAAPSEIVRTILQQATAVGSSTPSDDWGTHVSKMPEDPDKAIAIFDTGGSNPNPSLLLDFVTVQVRVRSKAGDNGGAWVKAKAVKDRLLGYPSATVGSDRVVSVISIGDIAFLGRDAKDRPEYVTNWRLIIEPATSDLTNRIAVMGS